MTDEKYQWKKDLDSNAAGVMATAVITMGVVVLTLGIVFGIGWNDTGAQLAQRDTSVNIQSTQLHEAQVNEAACAHLTGVARYNCTVAGIRVQQSRQCGAVAGNSSNSDHSLVYSEAYDACMKAMTS